MIEGGQMLMFADMVGGCGRQNADMSKKKDKKGKRKFTVATKIMKQKKTFDTMHMHVISIKTYFKIMMN